MPSARRGRFSGKSCVLCPAPSVGVGEHVWPAWLIDEFSGEGPFGIEKNGEPMRRRTGAPIIDQALQSVHVPMCEPCNNRLNGLVEVPAKPVVCSLLGGMTANQWPTISAKEAADLGRWFLKIGLLLAHPDATHDNARVEAQWTGQHDVVRPDMLAWMANGTAPPADFSIYLTRRSPSGADPAPGATQRLELPRRVVVDGQELRFGTWSAGIRGIETTIVWHPGWPIRHPLVDDGRAAILWPGPTAIDLSALTNIHPRELRFYVGGAVLQYTGDEYNQVEPLQVGQMPGHTAQPTD